MPIKISYSEVKQKYGFGNENLRIFWDFAEPYYQNSYLLFYQGDQIFENIDLDVDSFESDIVGIIIDGNLSANNIFNYDVDGAVHLIVFGDLHAKNIIIGGQDLRIMGKLEVKEVFVGSYNHGTIHVVGDTICPYILIDDYVFTTSGNVNSSYVGTYPIYYSNGGKKGEIYTGHWDKLKGILPDDFFGEVSLEHEVIVKKIKIDGGILLN